MYKLICSDIDGTLLDANRSLSDRTKAAFQNIDDDVIVILASSRMPSAMLHLQKELDIAHYPLICYNGGLVRNADGTVVERHAVPFELMELLRRHDFATRCNVSLYIEDDWFVDKEDYWTKREINNTKVQPTLRSFEDSFVAFQSATVAPQKIMCMGDKEVIDEIDLAIGQADLSVNRYRSKDTYLELSAVNTDKAHALSSLLRSTFTTIEQKDIIAFGDNFNDIDLLTYAGCGVAVGNARPELKTIADRVASVSNKEDAVAIVLEDVFGV